ncbi:MAG: cystathionine gamma-synthase [Planctomycetota bacterium]|nr:MAG: cystathionine gamma-synthase [Planctomycetota bacterium]
MSTSDTSSPLRGARFGTIAVHAGTEPEPVTGAIMTPIFQTSTYVQPYPARHKGYEYSRTQNPTREALERCVAGLEGARHAVAFGSGMAAIDAVLRLLEQGNHVVAGNDLYGGTYRLFKTVYERFGIQFTFVDTTDLDAVRAAIRPETALVWIESPSNPLLRVSDLAAIAEIAREHGALPVADNTFATPALQRPLALGCALVVHSTTKYVGGHSDVVGGAVATDDDELAERLRYIQNAAGGIPGPFDCFLTLRGAKTLHLRMERHCDNAERIAAFLQQHPRVARVHYPGLPEHPGHEVAARQMRRFGGMISFVLDGSVEDGCRLCTRTRLFALAESLGGVESLIEHPPSMTHAAVPAEVRRAAGLEDGLIRLSVGIEDAEDLIADLEQALAR